jgi:hypothetical protein
LVIAKRSAIAVAAALALSSPRGAQSGYELLQQALSKETDGATGQTRLILEEAVGLTDSVSMNLVGWTPSGDLLVERGRNAATVSETLIVSMNGGGPRPIAIPRFPVIPGQTRQDLTANWSPDGRAMVLGRVNRGWETFVIEHPLPVVPEAIASGR